MELLIVRHAIAVEHGDPAYDRDEMRPLTPDGIHKFRLAARGIDALDAKPDRILSSPLVRARQTAEILRDVLARDLKIEITQHLVPGGNYGDLVAAVTALGEGRVAVVGHEPHLSGFVSYLLAGSRGSAAVVFRKGAAALVSFPDAPAPGRGTLEWLIQPGALRELGKK
jgi:phosphohistidine phosphatase